MTKKQRGAKISLSNIRMSVQSSLHCDDESVEVILNECRPREHPLSSKNCSQLTSNTHIQYLYFK